MGVVALGGRFAFATVDWCCVSWWTLRVCDGGNLSPFGRGLTGASVGGVAAMQGLPRGHVLICLGTDARWICDPALPRALPEPARAPPLTREGSALHPPANDRRRSLKVWTLRIQDASHLLRVESVKFYASNCATNACATSRNAAEITCSLGSCNATGRP